MLAIARSLDDDDDDGDDDDGGGGGGGGSSRSAYSIVTVANAANASSYSRVISIKQCDDCVISHSAVKDGAQSSATSLIAPLLPS